MGRCFAQIFAELKDLKLKNCQLCETIDELHNEQVNN